MRRCEQKSKLASLFRYQEGEIILITTIEIRADLSRTSKISILTKAKCPLRDRNRNTLPFDSRMTLTLNDCDLEMTMR